MSCVYKHTFPNGAVYIGKTNMKPEDRWLNGWGYRTCPLMFTAIVQFGWNNVKHEIIADNLTEEEALKLESKEIRAHNAKYTMYNMAQISPTVAAQQSAHYIDIPNQKQKSRLHFVQADNPVQSQTRRKHYIIPLTTKPHDVHSCPIDVYTNDGVFVCTYPSIKTASLEMKINEGDIASCCKGVKSDGKLKYQCKGYIFRYHVE